MMGRTKYKNRKVSPVGKVLHKIQLPYKGTGLEYDSTITRVDSTFTATKISNIRYDKQPATPAFVEAIATAYSVSKEVYRELLRALYETLNCFGALRLHRNTRSGNLRACVKQIVHLMFVKPIVGVAKLVISAFKALIGLLKRIWNALRNPKAQTKVYTDVEFEVI